jgi:sulfonate transport system ATP-binding protein
MVPPPERLEVTALAKSYAGRAVLADLDLRVPAGEFVAIVGRSGCGKSTLLRLLVGLEAPDAGRITLGGADASDVRPHVRMMFQDARLLPWRSVLANVALGLPAAARGRAREVLRQVGLAERAGDWPATLSGGQRQRVALSRALAHEPSLLLLDEPLGALDALTRIEMQQLVESVWRARGFTALLVTHDVPEAVALADRVVVIERGRVTADVAVDLPRPRARGSAAFAALTAGILGRVLGSPRPPGAEPAPDADGRRAGADRPEPITTPSAWSEAMR